MMLTMRDVLKINPFSPHYDIMHLLNDIPLLSYTMPFHIYYDILYIFSSFHIMVFGFDVLTIRVRDCIGFPTLKLFFTKLYDHIGHGLTIIHI